MRSDNRSLVCIRRRLPRPQRASQTGAREALLAFVDLLLLNALYNLRPQSELESTSQDVFGSNAMDDFCNMAKKMIESADHVHVLCFTFQVFA